MPASIRSFCESVFGVPGLLRLRQLVLQLLEVPWVRHLLAGRQRGKVVQTQVDASTLIERSGGNIRDLNGDVQEPIAVAVSRKIGAVLDFAAGQFLVGSGH